MVGFGLGPIPIPRDGALCLDQFDKGAAKLEHAPAHQQREYDPSQRVDEVVVRRVEGSQRDAHNVRHGKLPAEPGMVEEDHRWPGNVKRGEGSELDRRRSVQAVEQVDVHEFVQPVKRSLVGQFVDHITVLVQHGAVCKPGGRSRKRDLYRHGDEVDPAETPDVRVESGSLLRMQEEVGSKEEGQGEVGEVGNCGEEVEDGVGELGEEAVGEGEEEVVLDAGQDEVVWLARHVEVRDVADLLVELEGQQVGQEGDEGEEKLLVADLPDRVEDVPRRRSQEDLGFSESGLTLGKYHPLGRGREECGGGGRVWGSQCSINMSLPSHLLTAHVGYQCVSRSGEHNSSACLPSSLHSRQ